MRLFRFDRCIEQFKHAMATCKKTGQPGRQLRQGRQRCVEHRQVGEKCHQGTERHGIAQNIASADVPDDQSSQTEDQGHHGRERGVGIINLQA